MSGLIYGAESVQAVSEFRQRRFGGPDVPIVEWGDCWATAVACFAGLEARDRNELHRRIVLSDLALTRAGNNPAEGGAWWNVTQRFLTEKVDRIIGWVHAEAHDRLDPDAVYIASGPSPRGDFDHSILTDGLGELVWDPHPSDDGLAGPITEFAGWWIPSEAAA